jgi:hypothetical protein
MKLEKALRVFPARPPKTMRRLRRFHSGFTDVLLHKTGGEGVRRGRRLRPAGLASPERSGVVCMERTNVRYLTGEQIPETLIWRL